ncbi:methionine gamma-lyase family protein [Lutispora thermophila]|uniref:Cystathionine beta-lyase family protein involved in aluminum resistance n=1 Tax=Lutispora thermophila DSM 19022 TaxID=1122184 RepID=A0A1M6F986_9FIRM|nr:methionine gamma-lyase family protein [Lutispora thermophila]SHI94245.1 Cystathionine beta-lyase family protein involved in aluminum resistance [Lutispora thermophila DSM 19022]
MHNITKDYLIKLLELDNKIIDLAEKCEKEVKHQFSIIEEIREYNQYKVLKSMQKNKLSDMHFNYSTGYGYGDIGRDTLDKVYSDVFNCEDALVRPNIVSGTHALSLCLFGILRPGDEMLAITGKPYDTLDNIIGINCNYQGSLKDYNIKYKQVDLLDDGRFNFDEIRKSINKNTKLVLIQRSTGYSWRKSLSLKEIEEVIKFIKNIGPDICCMVDNCYGEFMDFYEPTEKGADIMAGSLIKNPGGSIAPTGGYVAGKRKYVEMAADRLVAPGIGKETGATLGITRLLFQGLFLAPHVVSEAVKGAVFCSKIFSDLGYEVNPKFDATRSDIIQAIKFNDKDALIAFCKGIQLGSPVDSFVTPEPWDMPGYNDKIIMAAGAFVQGASIELSADAPIRPPYIAYLQGGITYDHAKIGILYAIKEMIREKLVHL